MDEQAFLDALRRDPDDGTLRLIYADWLEEQGDPRGEAIRISQQINQLPGWDPQMDALRRRRELLLQRATDEWRSQTGTDDAPVQYRWLSRVPQTLADWWGLYDALATRWLRSHRLLDGQDEALETAFERMSLPLPPALVEWHQREGHNVHMVRPQMLQADRRGGSLHVYGDLATSPVAMWLSDLSHADPPLHTLGGTAVWPSTSLFAMEQLLRRIRLRGRSISPINTTVEWLGWNLTPCAIPMFGRDGQPIRCFEGDGLLIWVSGRFGPVELRVSELRRGQYEEFLQQETPRSRRSLLPWRRSRRT